jgi:hypothetical protein
MDYTSFNTSASGKTVSGSSASSGTRKVYVVASILLARHGLGRDDVAVDDADAITLDVYLVGTVGVQHRHSEHCSNRTRDVRRGMNQLNVLALSGYLNELPGDGAHPMLGTLVDVDLAGDFAYDCPTAGR